MKTYDVHFNDSGNSNNKGFKESELFCREYIMNHNNGTEKGSYFSEYQGGIVSVVCNATGETIYSEDIV